MRIMMLSWEFPPRVIGGLSQHVFELSRSLAEAGNQVDVLTFCGENLPEKETMEGINIWRVTPYHGGSERDFIDWVHRLNFALIEKGALLCNRIGKYDLVHAHDWLVAYAGRGLKSIFRMPLLATIHATEFGRNEGLHTSNQRYISDLEWWLGYEAWKVICCSEHMKKELQHVFQLPEDKIAIIPNGIRPDAYEAEGIKPDIEGLSFDPEEKIVFFIGRLVQEKGVQVLLGAAPSILERFPGTKFVIAGTGPHKEHLEGLTHKLGLTENVLFCGYISDQVRNELYSLASVAVFPSLYEPFGIVALEAMISGAPVVVSSVGGLEEIVEHQVDGLKAYPGDHRSLADQICRLLENEEWAASLAEKAYQKAGTFSWDKIAQKTAEIYREIVFSSENKRWQKQAGEEETMHTKVKVQKGKESAQVPYLI
ncbi:MAG: glycosyltransferase family 4 protein [Firmicutes bacterium]|nr:glycosyltransferase family 4 protein [Bacillota bacterium]